MAVLRRQVLAAPVVAARPVVDSTETRFMALLNANSYQKGGWVLHMLRTAVGDSAFFAGVRSYVAHHRHGTAVTDDLQQEMEGAAGRPLGWFFDQWLRRPGFPELAIGWHHDARSGRVTLEVRQGSRFGPYRLPLTLLVDGAGGAGGAGGRPRRVRVDIPAEGATSIVLPGRFASRPRRLAIDPDTQLLGTFVVSRTGAAGSPPGRRALIRP
ncbi:MAG: hypothetical protein NVS9B3_09990 [Gemmatimonadaceae bacterium]